jgi:cbb3-type cytochrome oxidase subunit 1
MAGIYYMIPRLNDCYLYSERLASIHWWLTVLGFVGFFTVLTGAGLVQASAWFRGIPVSEIVPSLRPYYIGRAASGGVIILGQFVFAYNIVRTMLGHQSRDEIVLAKDEVPSDTVTA